MKRIAICVLVSYLGICSQVSGQSGLITTVAGSGTGFFNGGFSGDGGPANSATLDGPVDVAVDTSGNLFIADYGNDRICPQTETRQPWEVPERARRWRMPEDRSGVAKLDSVN